MQFSPTRSRVHLRPCTPYKSTVRLIQSRVNVWTVSIRLYYKTSVGFKCSLLTALHFKEQLQPTSERIKGKRKTHFLVFTFYISSVSNKQLCLSKFCSHLFDKRCTLSRITCKYFNFIFFPLIICNICCTGDQIICTNLFCNFRTSEWMSQAYIFKP